jgi:uncharacterized protein YcbX
VHDCGRVLGLFRYPVKSMSGELRGALELDPAGCVGDREWAARTAQGRVASGKATRRFEAVPGLLHLRSWMGQRGQVWIQFPDGRVHSAGTSLADAALSCHLNRSVRLEPRCNGRLVDDGPVSLIGTASITALEEAHGMFVDPIRFRPNILVQTVTPFAEDDWLGCELRLGSAILRVTMRSIRCVMIDMATAELPAQRGNLKTLGALNDARVGIIAEVVQPGRVRVGDDLWLCSSTAEPKRGDHRDEADVQLTRWSFSG